MKNDLVINFILKKEEQVMKNDLIINNIRKKEVEVMKNDLVMKVYLDITSLKKIEV